MSVEGHKNTLNNSHWKEKIRHTLQMNKIFVNVDKGIWKLA